MHPQACRLILSCIAVIVLNGIPVPGNAADHAQQAKALFQHPPRAYSTGPLWVWNDLLTDQEIRSTLRDLAGQDVKQVWVHPRPGLMTPYLSPEWFRLWKVALDEAERLDMNVWIYDENSYPSGFAGGWVPEEMPESRGRGLVLEQTASGPKWNENFIAVYRVGSNRVENITAQVKSGEAVSGNSFIVATQSRAGNSPWFGDRCYVNLLSPGVTEKFLDETLERYRLNVGDQFGKHIPGVFTDEPNIRPAPGLPWSEILAREFQKRWGYDLLDHLPSLTQPIGDWRKIRHDYYQTLNEQFIEHWSKPYHDYCETNHLELTGHYWDHEWPNCGAVPDNMAMYAWHQRPAIDCLMNQYAENTHAQFGNARMVKELSSIANQLGLPRTLCEVYGAGGWDLRFEDMKRIGDWLEVLGVNTLNQHLSYVTIRGARKRDHPQSFSYHEPWWKAYHVSAQYLARLSAAMSQGEQVNRVLVIEPTSTAWMYQGDEAKLNALGDAFFKLVMALESAQIEYDIGCEDVIARHGGISEGSRRRFTFERGQGQIEIAPATEFQIRNRSYSTVVIPSLTENLNSRTVELLERFLLAKTPGTVFCLGETPERVDGAVSEAVKRLAESPWWQKVTVQTLTQRLQPLPESDFAIQRQPGDQGILFHHRRELLDGELLLLVNTSIEHKSAGTIASSMNGMEQWDPYTGRTLPYSFEKAARTIHASFELPPSGSLLLFLSKADLPSAPVPLTKSLERRIAPLGPPAVTRLQPNVLTLDFVDVAAGGETRSNMYFYPANQFAWKKNGLERDPWDSAVQFKDELISKKLPAGGGFVASYHFEVESVVPTNLAIVIERPDLYTIECNGHPVLAKPGDWWLDKSFGRIPIAEFARLGENTVTIQSDGFTMFHELEPAYLLGNFALQNAEKGFVVVPDHPLGIGVGDGGPGWNAQGHPFYSGPVEYRQQFNLGRIFGKYQVRLPSWRGSVAKVTVNGKEAGYIEAPPWQRDITDLLREGDNIIAVTVIGTLKNTLGPHHGNPALGAAWPSAFQKGPASGPPPGNEYSTVAYGLFEPFLLEQSLPAGSKNPRKSSPAGWAAAAPQSRPR